MGNVSAEQIDKLEEYQNLDENVIRALQERQQHRSSDRKLELVAERNGSFVSISLTPLELERFLGDFPHHYVRVPDPLHGPAIPARDSLGNVVGAMDPSSYVGTMHALREGRELINPENHYSLGN